MQHNPYQKFAQYYDTYVQHFADDLPFYCDSIKGSKSVVEIGVWDWANPSGTLRLRHSYHRS